MNLIRTFFIIAVLMFSFSTCKKDSDPQNGTVTIGITDARSTQKTGGDIIDASKLSKFEITISELELRKENGDKIQALPGEIKVDLRNYLGTVKELSSINAPLGKYTGVIIHFSGISITYDDNNYTASTGSMPTVTLGDYPGVTLSTTEGVTNAFNADISVDITFNYDVSSENIQKFDIAIDAVGACYEIVIDCPVCTTTEQYFAGLRPIIEKHMDLYFEKGIQQIKYSPPLGIELSAGNSVNYYGIHTFVDFNGIGGTIDAHTSQHVYRGTDGALSVDAETMAPNSSVLTPNTINASGKTDVTANEVFDFTAIGTTLSDAGYTLNAGSTYFFSLRKTWTITSGTTEYSITRMCEPIPVLWPAL